MPVVAALDIFEDRIRQLGAGVPVPPVEQLGLQGYEQSLRDPVVEASPTLPMEPSSPTLRSRCPKAEGVSCTIAVMDAAIHLGTAARGGHLQRTNDQLGAVVDDGQIEHPALKASSTAAAYTFPSAVGAR